MKKIIKRILNEENSLQSKLMQMMKTKGVDLTSESVGGFDNLNKILKLDLDDVDVQEMLVKNFINFMEMPEIEVVGLEVTHSGSGRRIIKILFKTESDARNIESWVVYDIIDYLSKNLFPFGIKPAWEPAFSGGNIKIALNSELVKNEDIQESIIKVLKEERNHSKLIVKLLNRLIVSKYEDVCKIEVVNPSVDSDYSFYRVFVYFNQHGKNASKYWEENILNEVWEYVQDTFGISIALHSVRVPSCDDNKLNENSVDARFNRIKSMVDEFGVFNTIKAVGSYTKFKKMYGDNLTKDEKIVLIRDFVREYGEDGDYIDVMPYDIFVDIDHNQTDSYDYTTEVIYLNRGGYFNFRQYTYDDELEDYDWEDYHNGRENLFVLSELELENIIRVIFERIIHK
jgi:hypothetical protein